MPLLADPLTRELADQVAGLRADVDQLQRDGRSAQLGLSTLDGQSLTFKDNAGIIKAIIGPAMEPGDPYALKFLNGDPPSAPTGVTVEPVPAGGIVHTTGQHASGTPVDYLYSKVYLSSTSGFTPSDATFQGRAYGADSLAVGPLTGGQTYYVRVSSVNTSEKEGPASAQVSFVAGMVVAQAVLDNIVGTLALANGAVTEAKHAAGSVTQTIIADGAVSSPKIIAGGVQTINLAADSVAAGKVAADAISARELQALAVTAGKIAANAVTAGTINAGAVTAVKLESNLLMTTRLIVGSLNGARVEIHPTAGLQAFQSNGTTRTFHVDPATGNVVATGTFQTGFSGERLVLLNDGTMRFYNTGGQYAYISNNGDHLAFRGPTGGSNAGHLRLSANYVAINYGALNGTTPASFGADGAGIQSWGRLVGIRYEGRYAGDGTYPRVFILPTDSGGSDLGSANIHIINRSAMPGGPGGYYGNVGATISAPGENAGLVLNDGIVAAVDGSTWNYQRFICAGFDSASSSALKENIAEIVVPEGRSSWDIIEGAPSQDWHYTFQREEFDDDLVRDETGDPMKIRRRNPAIRPETWESLPDSDPNKWVEEDWVKTRAKRPRKKHRFPLAEDLAAVDPDLVSRGAMGTPDDLTVDLRDLVGVHHDAIDLLIKRVRVLENELVRNVRGLRLPPRPQRGDLIEGVGKLVSGRTKRTLDPETGQPSNRPKKALDVVTDALSEALQIPVGEPTSATGRGQFFERNGQLWYMNSMGQSRKVV